jgi:hypothetical protein
LASGINHPADCARREKSSCASGNFNGRDAFHRVPDFVLGHGGTCPYLIDQILRAAAKVAQGFARKEVSPEYLHKSGYWSGFCHGEAITD